MEIEREFCINQLESFWTKQLHKGSFESKPSNRAMKLMKYLMLFVVKCWQRINDQSETFFFVFNIH